MRASRAARLVLALAALAAGAPPVSANPGAEGEPAFGISGFFREPPKLRQATPVLIRVWGEDTNRAPVTSVTRISLPEGIEVVAGDTVGVAHFSKRPRARAERSFTIFIRPVREGTFVIRGTLEIDAGAELGIDQTDFVLPLEVRSDSVFYARAPRPTRFEKWRNGHRYRYGGPYLVPIDSSEALLQEEIDRKPSVKHEEPAFCSGCAKPLPSVVPFVVMVGSDGRPRETRFLDIDEQGSVDPSVVAAASGVLSRWEFEPARSKGRPVADFLVVRVPVRDGEP